MQTAVVMFSRKPVSRPRLGPPRRPRRSLLARLRDQIAILRMINLGHAEIGKALRISEEDARALSPKINKSLDPARLTRHAVRALLKGCHAHIGGRTIPTRAKNLTKIAAAYTYEELLDEPGIGTVTAIEIQLWLEEYGLCLRSPTEQ